MKNIRRVLYITSIVTVLLMYQTAKAQEVSSNTNTIFIYESSEANGFWPVKRVSLDQPTTLQETTLNLPYAMGPHAISYNKSKMAFATNDNLVSVVNFKDGTVYSTGITLHTYTEANPLIDDYYFVSSYSLMWSPDGNMLAFIGNDNTTRQDVIWIYDDSKKQGFKVVPPDLAGKVFIELSSWSPDGKWLSFIEGKNGDVKAGVVSHDGSNFIHWVPGTRTCRLVWSPDSTKLASQTACFEEPGGVSSIVILSFDAMQLNINTPVISIPGKNSLPAYWWYGEPTWQDNSHIVFARTIGIGKDLFTSVFKSEFVLYDVIHNQEQTVSEIAPTDAREEYNQGSWGFWLNKSGNELLGYSFTKQTSLNYSVQNMCTINNIRISEDGRYTTWLDGCSTNPDRQTTLHIVDNLSATEIVTISSNAQLLPIGFVLGTP